MTERGNDHRPVDHEREGESMERIRITVPRRFWEDHYERDLVCHSGEWREMIVKQTKSTVTVDLHPRDLGDLLDDADHYRQVEDYERSLRTSALATLKRIIAAFPDEEIRRGWAKMGICETYEAGEFCQVCGKKR